jgi:hypothetical protein
MSEIKTYEGFLSLREHGEAYDILFISSEDEPLAEVLDESIKGKQVTVRYWICDKQCTKEEASQDHVQQVMGKADTDYGAAYSEVTGYLWTDEEINIGGHDLLAELKGNIGKWLVLEVEVH